MDKAVEDDKTKILFIKKVGTPSATLKIMDDLAMDYSLVTLEDLGETVIPFLKQENTRGKLVQAMITPVHGNPKPSPRYEGESTYQYRLKNYSKSLNLLSRVHSEFPNMSVIAYTNAESCDEIEDLFMNVGKVIDIVHPHRPDLWYIDSESLKRRLRLYIVSS